MAEDALADIRLNRSKSQTKFKNLARFESLLADLADCILIFPESAGSFAELGFFSAHKKVSEKLLAVNDLLYQSEDSFLNLGPLAIINESSDFRPCLVFGPDGAAAFTDIGKRLVERLGSPRRRTVYRPKPFTQLTNAERLYSVTTFIHLLRIVHIATMPRVVEMILGGIPTRNQLEELIAVLVSAGYVTRSGEDQRYLVAAASSRPFLENERFEKVMVSANAYLLRDHSSLYSSVFD